MSPAQRDATSPRYFDTVVQNSAIKRASVRLIDQALKDLGDDANRVGVQSFDDIRKGYFLYHLKWSRKTPAGPPVHQPRHLIAFYINKSDDIIVARVFHERQMLSQHLTEPDDH